MATSAPVLSTPAEHIFDDPTPAVPVGDVRLSDEQLYLQYEIQRTVSEIRAGRWKRIALQFPDEMLVDAPRVFERLRDGLRAGRVPTRLRKPSEDDPTVESISDGVKDVSVNGTKGAADPRVNGGDDEGVEEKLTILADTSYGACCVDEIAAEHVDADVVVHYGRACLSPTARLPVIYVFTSKPLDLDAAVASFRQIYPDKDERVCLMADIPYNHHLPSLAHRLRDNEGYTAVFETEIIRDPSSLIPNRTLPPDAKSDPENLKHHSIFHISSPPTPLLLILSSRVKTIHILPTADDQRPNAPAAVLATATPALLRRRYALITRLATVPIFGILINTLSVSNYLAALTHCQNLIAKAGKKSYVFVVGKVNAAKVANFSEIGGWIVIGCWESSLIESKDFYRPIITPFELEVALRRDEERVWSGEWVGDFGALLGREKEDVVEGGAVQGGAEDGRESVNAGNGEANWDDEPSDDEPPAFDLRTGRYVSHSRPMGRPKLKPTPTLPSSSPTPPSNPSDLTDPSPTAARSSALVQRAKGDLALVNGTLSPAAEFLRTQRTWQGLGSDYEIAYERDDEGRIRGAVVEEGREGVARGYRVGGVENKS